MTDYDPAKNSAACYELAISEIRKHGWNCPANAGRCRQPECFSHNKCAHTGGPLRGDSPAIPPLSTEGVHNGSLHDSEPMPDNGGKGDGTMNLKQGWRCPHYRLGLCKKGECFADHACAHNQAPLPEHISEPIRRVMKSLCLDGSVE